jgi:hypothetical protein
MERVFNLSRMNSYVFVGSGIRADSGDYTRVQKHVTATTITYVRRVLEPLRSLRSNGW